MQTALLDFYAGRGTDSEGRTLQEIRRWDFQRLEAVHDYIQWLFPLRVRSQFNPDAPLLDDETVRRFLTDDARAFLVALETVCAEPSNEVGARTLNFWRTAIP